MNNFPRFFDAPHIISGYDKTESILVGLSGGADSVALLHLLCQYAKNTDCKIYAAHINHNIRTEQYSNEAKRDENFCRELCDGLGVALFVLNADIPKLAKESGESLEGAARNARYSFFSNVMNENRIKLLALAHNANDNLETQIFNLCRGASVGGIIGIRQTRDIDSVKGGKLIRPILSGTKQEILKYCQDKGIDYMTDSTNFELDATRNKIRHLIIPSLEEIFPAPYNPSMRLSRAALEYEDYITSEATKILDRCSWDGENISIPLELFNSLHISLQKKLVVLMLNSISDISIEFTHIESIIRLAGGGTEKKSIDLPRNIRCVICDGKLTFGSCFFDDIFPYFETKLCRGFNIIENSPYAIGVFCNNKQYNVDSIYTLDTFCYVNCDTINNMSARQRKEGDKILDGGNHKKLKKLMCDKKIPQEYRSLLPIITVGEEIIYVPYCAVADSVKAAQGEEKLKICIYKIKKQKG